MIWYSGSVETVICGVTSRHETLWRRYFVELFYASDSIQRLIKWWFIFKYNPKHNMQPPTRKEKRAFILYLGQNQLFWWKTKVVPQPFRIRYRSALWLRSNFLNPSEFHPCILTCSKKFLPWGWAIRWAIRWDVRGIWTIGPTKCRSLSESPPDLSVPQCVALVTSAFCVRKLFLLSQTESSANAH